jgi:hypothetical protein
MNLLQHYGIFLPPVPTWSCLILLYLTSNSGLTWGQKPSRPKPKAPTDRSRTLRSPKTSPTRQINPHCVRPSPSGSHGHTPGAPKTVPGTLFPTLSPFLPPHKDRGLPFLFFFVQNHSYATVLAWVGLQSPAFPRVHHFTAPPSRSAASPLRSVGALSAFSEFDPGQGQQMGNSFQVIP